MSRRTADTREGAGHALHVGFDAHMVGSHETGNETYALGLIEGFSELDRELDVSVYHVGRPWQPNDRNLRFRKLLTSSPFFRLTAELPLRSIRDRLDVVHTTYTAPLWTQCPLVLSVHDISYASHPEWFSFRDRSVLSATIPWSIRRAARVITLSETCRADIVEHYRVPEEKVVSIHIAAGPAAQSLAEDVAVELLTKLGLDSAKPYLLAVGNLQPRKNLRRLIQAFRRILAAGADIDLVIAGPQHYRAEEVLTAAREASERIRFTGYLNDVQLAACYQRAAVFVFPSLFEGFGIPPLEAMAHGTPVACSRVGALLEVCGPAAHYFDPLDEESIATVLQELLDDRALRTKLIAAGTARAKQFSWRQAADQTLTVYREVTSGRSLRQTSV